MRLAHLRNVITSHFLALFMLTAPAFAEPMKIVTSFSILKDMSARIAGPEASVRALVGPNSDAHVYRPTPQDAKAVKEARLFIVNGMGLEGFLPRLLSGAQTKAALVTASTGIHALQASADEARGHTHSHSHREDHGKADPHAWQSIEAAKIYVSNIRNALVKADPAHAEGYAARASAYLTELDALKAEMSTAFSAIPREKRVIVTSHDALGYFAREFGFDLYPIQGLSTETEPNARDVARIIRLVKAKKAHAIFVENIRSPKLATQIAQESGAKIGAPLFSDALSDEKGPAATYIAMMRNNMNAIVAALRE